MLAKLKNTAMKIGMVRHPIYLMADGRTTDRADMARNFKDKEEADRFMRSIPRALEGPAPEIEMVE